MPPISLVLLLLLVPPAAAAQDGLAARNEAFLRAIDRGPRDSVAAFFPRRGEWAWVQALREAPPWVRPAARNFGASETLRLISAEGPLCDSFWQGTGAVGPFEERLAMQVAMKGTRWRRVAGNRFVPPGEPARSPVFVQWAREDGRWVVSSFGDVDVWFPRVIGRVARDTVIPGAPAYAAGESWYVDNQPFVFEGWRYVKYGLPRPLADSLLARVGRRGAIGIYAERGDAEAPDVLYLPTASGVFQPYQVAEGHAECR